MLLNKAAVKLSHNFRKIFSKNLFPFICPLNQSPLSSNCVIRQKTPFCIRIILYFLICSLRSQVYRPWMKLGHMALYSRAPTTSTALPDLPHPPSAVNKIFKSSDKILNRILKVWQLFIYLSFAILFINILAIYDQSIYLSIVCYSIYTYI